MRIYLLKRLTECDFDEMHSIVLVAQGPVAARKLAAKHAGDEGSETWRDVRLASVESLGHPHIRFEAEQVICRDFHNG